ncbi:hypothetical protein Sango_2100700 [Sesamum angolense]|uniref:Uncharacterized protein n=1 Tax=Sesamum angolense TaxID=2727404 RepID=A0AAE1WBW5_9LAMI|nr:hypothetical protein Sango_2100700 [Sesamum angolense]
MEMKCDNQKIDKLKVKLNMFEIEVESRGKVDGEDYWHLTGFYGEPDTGKDPTPGIYCSGFLQYLVSFSFVWVIPTRFSQTMKRKDTSSHRNSRFAHSGKHWRIVVVKDSWNESIGNLELEMDLRQQLEGCKLRLIKWNKKQFRDTRKMIEIVSSIQLADFTKESRTCLSSSKVDLETLLSVEEIKLKQWGKETWLTDRDSNTMFLHPKASQGKKFNQIERVRDELGQWCEDSTLVQGVIQRYFHTIFSSTELTKYLHHI